jgi:hypothetical protein
VNGASSELVVIYLHNNGVKLLSNDLDLYGLGHCRADDHTNKILSHDKEINGRLNEGKFATSENIIVTAIQVCPRRSQYPIQKI